VIELKVILIHARITENGDITVLAWAASESKPGVRHGVYILLDRNGRIVRALCDCEGFVYRRNCKHVEWVRVAALAKLGKVKELPVID
jgi:hypothetical protein